MRQLSSKRRLFFPPEPKSGRGHAPCPNYSSQGLLNIQAVSGERYKNYSRLSGSLCRPPQSPFRHHVAGIGHDCPPRIPGSSLDSFPLCSACDTEIRPVSPIMPQSRESWATNADTGCSLITPGQVSPHLHQIIGGVSCYFVTCLEAI
jgi:hypothetical protein